MFLCVKDLCFSNIPSKSDRYKYYSHCFFLGKCLREREINKKEKVYPACPMCGARRIHLIIYYFKRNMTGISMEPETTWSSPSGTKRGISLTTLKAFLSNRGSSLVFTAPEGETTVPAASKAAGKTNINVEATDANDAFSTRVISLTVSETTGIDGVEADGNNKGDVTVNENGEVTLHVNADKAVLRVYSNAVGRLICLLKV